MVLSTLLHLLAALAGSPPVELELEMLNGTYTDIDWPLQPIQRGSFAITLSSPRHRLEVLDHRLTLRHREGNTYFLAAEVEIEADGDLVAVVASPAGNSTLDDHVVVPRQRLEAQGIVRVLPVEGSDGVNYLMTLVEQSSSVVELQVETEIATGVLAICDVFDRLPIPLFSCDGLDAALRTFRVPTPTTGSSFLIESQQLDSHQIELLDRLLVENE